MQGASFFIGQVHFCLLQWANDRPLIDIHGFPKSTLAVAHQFIRVSLFLQIVAAQKL
jgi:hypothetical protein